VFTKVKTPEEIERLRASGQMLATVLKVLDKQIGPGHTTLEADALARTELKKLGGKPAFLGYDDFPAVLCTSVNDEIVHGLPTQRELKDGDLITFDFGVNYEGMITDAAFTKYLGTKPSQDIQRLLKGTAAGLPAAAGVLKDGVRVGDISAAVEAILKAHRLGIVREFVGHGVGHQVHEEPNIPNYGTAGTGPVLQAGMTIAIEPMAMLGEERIAIYADGWTAATADHSLSAHFEETILITKNGAEILTEREA
jgi:methionyl aminopeptidase